MSAGEILLWVILPYAAMATFVVGHVVALPHRPVRLDERLDAAVRAARSSAGPGPAFHYGALGRRSAATSSA